MISRKEAEAAIFEHLNAVADIVKEYGSPSGYLTATIFNEKDYISFSNACFTDGADLDKPLEFWTHERSKYND